MNERLQLKGRFFQVTLIHRGLEVFNLAEVLEGLEEAIGLIDITIPNLRLKGVFFVRDNNFAYVENTTEEEAEICARAKRLNDLLENADLLSAGKQLNTNVGAIMRDVIEGAVSSVLGAQQINNEVIGQGKREREAQQKEYVALATVWAAREDLTPDERCHGVARDAYMKTLFAPTIVDEIEYRDTFDVVMVNKIRDRTMRAGKELFGR